MQGDNVMDMLHTETPSSQRGKGIAGVITEAAMQYCEEHRLNVIPSCTYIANTFLPKNSKYKHLIVKPVAL